MQMVMKRWGNGVGDVASSIVNIRQEKVVEFTIAQPHKSEKPDMESKERASGSYQNEKRSSIRNSTQAGAHSGGNKPATVSVKAKNDTPKEPARAPEVLVRVPIESERQKY